MRKVLVLCLVVLLVFSFSITGCNSKDTSEKSESTETTTETETTKEEEEKPAEKAEISFWAYNANDNNDDILKSIVSSYEQVQNAEVELVLIPRSDFITKLNTAIAVGNEPDVSYLDQPLVALFARDEVLLDITAYADGEDGIDKEGYFQGALDTNLVGDKYFGLPLSHTCIAMFYNKDIVPEAPKTWSEMMEIAKKVYKPGEIAAFERPWDGGGGAWMFPAYIGTAGGKMVTDDMSKAIFDSPEGIEALEFFYQDLLEYSEAEVYQSSNAFGNGMVAMRFSGSWDIGGYVNDFPELNFGVALIPKKDGADYASNMGGENIVAYNTSEFPEAAFQLMKWITNDSNSLPMARHVTGNFPVRVKALEDSYYKENEHIVMFLEQAKYARPRPRIISWLKINDEVVGQAINEFIAGEKTAEQALTDAAARANQIIADDNAQE